MTARAPRRPARLRAPPLRVLEHFAVAASTAGGCIQAELAAGPATVPAGAQPIQVGTYEGFMSSNAPTRETLHVAIEATDGNHYLVLSAIGLSPTQLIAIVTSGLPGFAGSR